MRTNDPVSSMDEGREEKENQYGLKETSETHHPNVMCEPYRFMQNNH